MTATQPEGLDMQLTDEQKKALEWAINQAEWSASRLIQGYADTFRALLSASKPAAPDIKVKNPKFKDGFQRFDWLCSLLPEGTNWGDVLDPNVLDDILLAAASPAAPAQSGEPVNNDQIVKWARRMTLPLDDSECVALVREIIAATQPSPTAVVLDERAAQWQSRVRNVSSAEWINITEEGAATIREKYSDSYELRALFERAAFPQPVAQPVEQTLPTMRNAFRVTETEGDPDPSKQRFHMRFTFRSMEELHAADDQWRAFATQPVEQTRALTEVGFIVHDDVHGWHFAPTVAWTYLGKGCALYAMPAARPASGETET